ncbi:unnamed protein product [Adineta ricciae]|uniref:Uncharacterized protein n=2 Tax=Adineta ricciae TaxID=249248 RepID=A0A814TEH1_ADIRI|nr:unnamed protein product [Adineta ricciae]
MGAVADGALSAQGKVIGWIPTFMKTEILHPGLTEVHEVESMHIRKHGMMTNSDALIALPGGPGTIEELMEAITWRRLKLIGVPIFIINLDGYYNPLLELFENMRKACFIVEDMTDLQINTKLPLRRNRPGTKAAEWCHWPEETSENMDSLYHIQQYIQQSIRRNPSDIDFILQAPDQQDEGVWKYEHLRQFCLELNDLTVLLQKECLPETCSQMTATEQWIFLCAAHKNPKECPAIDYTRHTLDGAASLLNSNKYFPSRISIKETSIAKLGSVCRRIYRIFSHAYYHHRTLYDEFEDRTHLCRRFTVFALRYGLIPKDNLIVPINGVNQDVTTIMQQQTSPVKSVPVQSIKDNDSPPSPVIPSTAAIESDA